MPEAWIIEAKRTPIGRGKMGKGDLSGFHPASLLEKVQSGLLDSAGVDPKATFELNFRTTPILGKAVICWSESQLAARHACYPSSYTRRH